MESYRISILWYQIDTKKTPRPFFPCSHLKCWLIKPHTSQFTLQMQKECNDLQFWWRSREPRLLQCGTSKTIVGSFIISMVSLTLKYRLKMSRNYLSFLFSKASLWTGRFARRFLRIFLPFRLLFQCCCIRSKNTFFQYCSVLMGEEKCLEFESKC